MLKQLVTFLDAIRCSCLLKPAQIEQITSWITDDSPDPQAIAREIVQRGWLTAFQVKLFWKNRGGELFLGQYVLLDKLGEGGMGEVFRAKHRRMDRLVALKVIRKERLKSPDAVRRFGREIQAAAQLAHENIVMAYDADQAGDRHFFAMEYIEGINLSKLVREHHPIPIEQACDCIRQAAVGLQHAFERGMVHRDIKPSNLLLNERGTLKILDMGLARLLESPDGEPESRITQEGLVVGTPDFLAPEQARNARTADTRTDISPLGCTFYFLLCGHPPYPQGTPTEKMLKHTMQPAPPLTRPDVPPALASLIERMMAKKPEDRFQTPDAVAYALQNLHAGTSATPNAAPPTVEQSRRPPEATPLAPTAKQFVAPPTDSNFQLPAPVARKGKLREKTRWNKPIAAVIGLLVLAGLAAGIWIYVKRNDVPPPLNLEKELTNNHGMTLNLIAPGSFQMGSPENELGRGIDEGPVHIVRITKPYYLSNTEVTLAQWKSVMGRLPRAYRDDPENTNAPVAHVSLRDVTAFLDKLNADAEARKPGWEYRLPTEAEWEYACRAGTTTRFWTGNSLTKKQAFIDETGDTAKGVGRFAANPWGLHDMHGSMAEWTSDCYDEGYYSESPGDDPRGPDRRRSIFVVRGGSYLEPANQCRSARRRGLKEETTAPDVGFRVVYAQVRK